MRPLEQASPRKSLFTRAAAILSFWFAFTCFLPNPAWPLGTSVGLQVSQVLVLTFLPIIVVLGLPKRDLLALVLLVLPIMLSGFFTVLARQAISAEVVVNTIATWLSVLMILLLAG